MHPFEPDFRRRWYSAHVDRFESDDEARGDARDARQRFVSSADEALGNLAALQRTGDAEGFRAVTQVWAVKPDTLAFNGFAGQMLLNQLVKHSDDLDGLGRLLADTLSAPDSDAAAEHKLTRLLEHIERVRRGTQPAPRSALFLLSYFWALADHAWPVHWASAAAFTEFVTGTALPSDPLQRYRQFVTAVRELDDDAVRFERVAVWWERAKPYLADPVLVDRCAFGEDAAGMDHEDLARNASALVAYARHVKNLAADVEEACGRALVARVPGLNWKTGRPRSDTWIDWTHGQKGPGIRVWVNHLGMAIGLKPGLVRPGWYDEAAALIKKHQLPELQIMNARGSEHGIDVGFIGGASGEFLYGRWYPRDELTALDLQAAVLGDAAQLRPVLDALVAAADGEDIGPPVVEDDPLLPLAEEFRKWGYPRAADDVDRADRARFAALLAADAITDADITELSPIWNSRRYGGPGPMRGLNRTVQDLGAHPRLLASLRHLCWGPGSDAARIDDLLTDPQWKIAGLGESVIMKMLAITHPERYLPVFPYGGDNGKQRLLALVDLPEPVSSASAGSAQVDSNDRLRGRVEGLFPDDPWGMTRFLLWLAARGTEPDVAPDTDPIADLAEELLLDRAFLDDLVDLLADRGQVILYGPPGTGKTYIAKKLAEVLAPEASRRAVVQFHPSTSYEDFVEGYRPVEAAGGVTYRLVDGPLRALAGLAKDAPGTRHVMLIDEINRGNLPKILGELLFLLEYRDEKVSTLYRPEEPFELPSDLWFIGTMNTADRSIALIDAALRRRFHFVPVYPDSGPFEGLLERWLHRHGEPEWVAGLVAMVNAELVDTLGGPHLQIGPSHFMRRGLDEPRVSRIWRYNVEPLLEDQFFGDSGQIERFRFGAVHRRWQAQVGPTEVAGDA